jgi:DNA-binding MarR family transcriptional regulator
MLAQSRIAATPSTAGSARLAPAEEAAWRGFLRVHAALMHALDADLHARHDLPLSSYEVLLQLAESPDRRLRMSDLAQSVLISPSGLTRLVDRLVREGLVERRRCSSDARGTYAVLTDDGMARLREAADTHLEGVRRRFLARLSDEDQRRLNECWQRLLA